VTRRPFDPRELGTPDEAPDPELERAAAELARYRDLTADVPSGGFTERVMAAVDREPAPRRGPFGWLLSAKTWQQPLRAVAVAGVVVLAVGGALVAGEMAGLIRQAPAGASATPAVTAEPRRTASPEISPSLTPPPSPTESPGTPEPTPSPEPSATQDSSEPATPSPTSGATRTPSPSASGHESETSQPSATATSSDG
jgi:hypothetical protein